MAGARWAAPRDDMRAAAGAFSCRCPLLLLRGGRRSAERQSCVAAGRERTAGIVGKGMCRMAGISLDDGGQAGHTAAREAGRFLDERRAARVFPQMARRGAGAAAGAVPRALARARGAGHPLRRAAGAACAALRVALRLRAAPRCVPRLAAAPVCLARARRALFRARRPAVPRGGRSAAGGCLAPLGTGGARRGETPRRACAADGCTGRAACAL